MLIMCLGTGLSVFAENEQNDAAEYHGTESIPTSGSEDYTRTHHLFAERG